MDDGSRAHGKAEEFYTLLCVRDDGVASFVDVYPATDFTLVHRRAQALLNEHRSSMKVEIWQDGALLEQLERAPA